ncbi:hypothetical protein AOLI_G00172080 [Acnodon oligacanthus]
MEVSCVDQRTINYIANTILTAFVDYIMTCCKAARTSPDTDIVEERSQEEPEVQEVCSTVLSKRSPLDFEKQIQELGGSSDVTDLSDECSEIFIAWPDSSSSIPAVQVTEATCLPGDSEDSDVENNDNLEVPACPDGTADSTPTRAKKWKKLRPRISSFLRRVFCFGCLPSQRVVPL